MIVENLILSNKLPFRITRHLLFWICFSTAFHFYNDNRTVMYIAGFVPGCMVSAYLLVYVALPVLEAKRYGRFMLAVIATYILVYLVDLLGAYIFFLDWNDPVTTSMIVGQALYNQLIAMCVGCIALCVKSIKRWYHREIDNLALIRQKAKNELELEKANLYPELILQSLASLQARIVSGAEDSPVLLLKLSDTLSHILYDSQDDAVELEKELQVVRNIVEFKRIHAAGKYDIQLGIIGKNENKGIPPLTLFRILESQFGILGNGDTGLLDVDVILSVEEERVVLELNAEFDNANWMNCLQRSGTEKSIKQTLFKNLEPADFDVTTDEHRYSMTCRFALVSLDEKFHGSNEATNKREHVLA